MIQGLYEQLINNIVLPKLNDLNPDEFYIKQTPIDKNEASRLISQYLANVIKLALSLISGEDSLEKQIDLSNKIIRLLKDELSFQDFSEDIISSQGKILSAVFSKLDAPFKDFDKYLKEITPYTRLSQSELFTGNNAGISLESELKKKFFLLIRFVFSFPLSNGPASEFLKRNCLNSQSETNDAQEVSGQRWKIEQFYREVKQITGIERCQCRLNRSQRNHIASALLVWLVFKELADKTKQTVYQLKNDLLSDYLKQQLRNSAIAFS